MIGTANGGRSEIDNPPFGDNGHFLTCLQEELFPDILRYHHLKFRGYGCSTHFSSKKSIDSKIVKQYYSFVKSFTQQYL